MNCSKTELLKLHDVLSRRASQDIKGERWSSDITDPNDSFVIQSQTNEWTNLWKQFELSSRQGEVRQR